MIAVTAIDDQEQPESLERLREDDLPVAGRAHRLPEAGLEQQSTLVAGAAGAARAHLAPHDRREERLPGRGCQDGRVRSRPERRGRQAWSDGRDRRRPRRGSEVVRDRIVGSENREKPGTGRLVLWRYVRARRAGEADLGLGPGLPRRELPQVGREGAAARQRLVPLAGDGE